MERAGALRVRFCRLWRVCLLLLLLLLLVLLLLVLMMLLLLLVLLCGLRVLMLVVWLLGAMLVAEATQEAIEVVCNVGLAHGHLGKMSSDGL